MRLLLFLSSCLLLQAAQAQYWEFGGSAGVTFYHGDLAPDFSMQTPGVGLNFLVHRNVDPRVSLRFGASFGTISASDANSPNAYNQARNLSFQSTILEGSLGMEFNFLPYHHHSVRGRRTTQYTPYLLAGVGIFHHRPRAVYLGGTYDLQSLGTEGQVPGEEYGLIQPNLIVGGGFKFDINSEWSVVIEGATRILFFDYLDDVSGTYADPRLIDSYRGSSGSIAVELADRSDEIGEPMGFPGRQRGDANNNDGYTMFTIGLVYTMRQPRCPAW